MNVAFYRGNGGNNMDELYLRYPAEELKFGLNQQDINLKHLWII